MPSYRQTLAALDLQLQTCLLSDEHRLRPRLQGVGRRLAAGKPIERAMAALAADIEAAVQVAAQRIPAWLQPGETEPCAPSCSTGAGSGTTLPARSLDRLNYPAELPVVMERERIAAALRDHQVVVVAGETGSGKTTQLPKICLEVGRGRRGLIGHTQPRRLAARTVAARIAAELQTELGAMVGYQVRFTEQVAADSLIKLMTDGILLAEIQRDPLLLRYDTLIIDEAHERSLNIDFLLGYLRRLLPKRPDLKLLITSATIDVERFSEHFGGAPVIEVSGRSYPVEIRYRPLADLSPDGDLGTACIAALQEIVQQDRGRGGDVLIFLPGEREIRELARELRRSELPGLEVLPLYARLSLAEQGRVFDLRQRRGRRVVLATNVAETSLTVPGIHYVIDTGLARISRYSVRSKLQRLPVEAISQASANQRAGRCGRIAPGICYRLYDEQDYQLRPAFTDPEIRRTNLAAVILQMLTLGLGKIDAFPFLDPPEPRQIGDGFKLLEELGAVDTQRRLTERGRVLGRLPVDPRIARMLVEAQARGALTEVLIIASALSSQDPRERPADRQQASATQHARFEHPESDFMGFVALWQYVEQQRQELSASQFRKLCEREFLSWLRLREWRDTHRQLRQLCQSLRHERGPKGTPSLEKESAADRSGWRENQQPADYQAIHSALLAGLLSHIARRDERRDYIAARNRRVRLFPGSALAAKPPPWLVAAEIVETSQVYARLCARIEPDWVFGLNDELLKRSWTEPYWHARSGRVMARETVSLYGLVIRDGQRVHYGPIDPGVSREVFIRSALAEDRLPGDAPYQRHNRELIAEIEALEDKGRRRDILADQQTLFDFFAGRVPADITTARQFERWRRQAERAQPELLFVPRELLMRHAADAINEAQFPNVWQWQDLELPLQYRFEPGHPEDGVTLVVPIALLNRVPPHRLEYLVPGLLRDKCIALLKTLPKAWRRHFVPAPDAVDAALAHLRVSEQPLTEALGDALAKVRGVQIPPDAWRPEQLEPFYHMHVRVLGADGEPQAQGRNLQSLTGQLREAMQEALRQRAAQHSPSTDGDGHSPSRPDTAQPAAAGRCVERWDFGTLPEQVEISQGGARALAYPALVVDGQEVVLTLLESPQRAHRASIDGVVRLLMRETADTVKYLRKELLRGNALNLQLAGMGQRREDWLDALLTMTYRQVFLPPDADGQVELPRDENAFQRLLAAGRNRIVGEAQRLAALLMTIGQAWAELRKRRSQANDLAWLETLGDIQRQLDALLAPGFILRTPLAWLERYPVYLAAIGQRLDKLRGHYQRDRELGAELGRLQGRLDELLGKRPELAEQPEVQRYRWLLEELRVSLFAQQLGTVAPVSVKRLDQSWQQVEEARKAGRLR